MLAYGFAIFTGAFLLFQVQPLIAKFLLPWFGGAPSVWTTCMLFFQVLLLGGYAYAHVSSRKLSLRGQILLHLGLIGAALATLPITPGDSWKPQDPGNPVWRIIAMLSGSVGLPYFVLSATAPLVQHWFSRTNPGRSPFRLYALSNTGSLLALLTYPTLLEAWFTRSAQAFFWGTGLFLYASACVWCATRAWKADLQTPRQETLGDRSSAPAKPTSSQKLLWVLLPFCASVLLLAITNKICQDVAVIAYLWVLPLTAYLLSFIICFDRAQWYHRLGFGVALFISLGSIAYLMSAGSGLSLPLQILIYLGALFVCCMVCHGEVYRLRPDPSHLTSFYLLISTGGALGGIFVAVIAPAIFSDYFELHCGLLLCGALFLLVLAREHRPPSLKTLPAWWMASGLALLVFGLVLWSDTQRYSNVRVYRSRNFYGVLNVYQHVSRDPTLSLIEFMHGHVAHGMQFLHPSRAAEPTLYFTPSSGVGRAMALVPGGNRRIGVVGLGAGALASYLKPGDCMRYYEINPAVEEVARRLFTYLTNAAGEVTVVLGDARLSLEREPPQNFDLLVLDAFNSDSVPMHLLTREAFQVYQRHVKTNAVVVVQVSNMSINLEPLVMQLAREFGYEALVIENRGSPSEWWVLPSTWMILHRDPQVLNTPSLRQAARPPAPTAFDVRLWTDDFSALFPVLRWNEFFRTKQHPSQQYIAMRASLSGPAEAASAIARFREALKQDPNSALAMNNLSVLLATASDPALRNGAEAVQLAEKACSLTQYGNSVMLTTLGAAYAEAGRFEDAIATAEKATLIAQRNGEQPLVERNRELLELYRKNEPYHQPTR